MIPAALEQMAVRCETPEFRPSGDEAWELLACLCRLCARLMRAQTASARLIEDLRGRSCPAEELPFANIGNGKWGRA